MQPSPALPAQPAGPLRGLSEESGYNSLGLPFSQHRLSGEFSTKPMAPEWLPASWGLLVVQTGKRPEWRPQAAGGPVRSPTPRPACSLACDIPSGDIPPALMGALQHPLLEVAQFCFWAYSPLPFINCFHIHSVSLVGRGPKKIQTLAWPFH